MKSQLATSLLYAAGRKAGKTRLSDSLPAEYEEGHPWTKTGIDLLMGSPGDKKASFRDRMFLPVELKNGLSELLIRREGKTDSVSYKSRSWSSILITGLQKEPFYEPLFVFCILLIIVIDHAYRVFPGEKNQ